MPHTVLVVDDEDLVREAYRAFFARRTDFVLAGEAADGAAAVGAFRRLGPDVVLMDLQMPGTSGIEATRAAPAPAHRRPPPSSSGGWAPTASRPRTSRRCPGSPGSN